MRSDSVVNVSAVRPLAHHAVLCVCVSPRLCVPVCVGEVTIRAWVVTAACCRIERLEELFTLYLCAK